MSNDYLFALSSLVGLKNSQGTISLKRRLEMIPKNPIEFKIEEHLPSETSSGIQRDICTPSVSLPGRPTQSKIRIPSS
jgi:hypothetical protein